MSDAFLAKAEPRRRRAAIVGLGQVGLLFDQDTRRSGVWTHFSAYERLADRFELVAVVDPDAERRALASARNPSVRAYERLELLLEHEPVEVLSVCTPAEMHAAQLIMAAGRVQAVICEKPLGSANLSECQQAVAACEALGTRIAVNYHRRFAGVVPSASRLLRVGALGSLRFASLSYAGPLDAMGSHAVDLMRHLVGELTLQAIVPGAADHFVATFTTPNGTPVTVNAIAPREDFLFDVDLIGAAGRMRISGDGAELSRWTFAPSPRYGGYRELEAVNTPDLPPGERFLPTFLEVADALDRGSSITCDGQSALQTQILLERLRAGLGARATGLPADGAS